MIGRAPRKPLSLNDYVRSQIDEGKARQRLNARNSSKQGGGKVKVNERQSVTHSSNSSSIPGIPSSDAQKFIKNSA